MEYINNRTVKLWLYGAKGVAIAFAALLLKAIVAFSTWMTYSADGPLGDMENYAIYIVVFISSLFVYNSVIGILFTFDYSSAERFSLKFGNGGIGSLKLLFSDKYFTAQSIATSLTLSFAALFGASPEIMGMFYLGEGKAPYSVGILPFIFTLLISSLIITLAGYETLRYWRALYAKDNLKELKSKPRLMIRIAAILILYPIVLPYMPLLLYVLMSVFGVIRVLARTLTVPGLIALTLLIIGLFIGAFILLAFRKRKKFFEAVKTVVREHGFYISDIKNPYSSLLSRSKCSRFTVTYKKTNFDCVVIGHIFKTVPICFTADGMGFFRHRLGTKRHNITLERHFEYPTDQAAVRIMIIEPSPKDALIIEDDKEKRLFNADKLWSYVVYEGEAFIGALDRTCLGRYDDKKV